MIVAADDYPLLDLLWTVVLFFGLLVYFWLVITAFGHLFRRHDKSGWAKAGWSAFIIALPLIGALTYLIDSGQDMAEDDALRASELRRQTEDYIRSVTPAAHPGIEEIARAKELLDRGAISPEEFEQLKRRALV
jgi:Short C-terminal domain/Phospholipase_D-nuclease N-terminal